MRNSFSFTFNSVTSCDMVEGKDYCFSFNLLSAIFLSFCLSFSLIRTCICETYVQCFQFKILNDILFTNSPLSKIGLIERDLCTFCNIDVETVDHLFFYCVYSRVFWDEFESYWFAIYIFCFHVINREFRLC